jgi:Na+-transporting NADH:ubiquinone oxidoreductase subunit A
LFHDKKHENVVYAAPVSGEIVEIKRGEKRKLLEIKILADKKVEHETFKNIQFLILIIFRHQKLKNKF